MAKILVIEDEAAYCDSLAIVLSRAGHEVRIARSSHHGIRKGIAYGPDLVITDWMLKNDLHGGHVAGQIRAVHARVKIIVITGYVDVAQQVEESYKFVSEVIQKPFRTMEIIEVVARVLGQEDKLAWKRGKNGSGLSSARSMERWWWSLRYISWMTIRRCGNRWTCWWAPSA